MGACAAKGWWSFARHDSLATARPNPREIESLCLDWKRKIWLPARDAPSGRGYLTYGLFRFIDRNLTPSRIAFCATAVGDRRSFFAT
jgi:hypothetical protein